MAYVMLNFITNNKGRTIANNCEGKCEEQRNNECNFVVINWVKKAKLEPLYDLTFRQLYNNIG